MAHADDYAALDALDLALSPVQRLSAAILNRCVLDWRQQCNQQREQRADVVRFLESDSGALVCACAGTEAAYVLRRLQSYG